MHKPRTQTQRTKPSQEVRTPLYNNSTLAIHEIMPQKSTAAPLHFPSPQPGLILNNSCQDSTNPSTPPNQPTQPKQPSLIQKYNLCSQCISDAAKPPSFFSRVDCQSHYQLNSRGNFSTFPLSFEHLFQQNLKLEAELKKRRKEEKIRLLKMEEKKRKKLGKFGKKVKGSLGVRRVLKKKSGKKSGEGEAERVEFKKQRVIRFTDGIAWKVAEAMEQSKKVNMVAAEEFCQLLFKHKMTIRETVEAIIEKKK
jgi:hypothetical protein